MALRHWLDPEQPPSPQELELLRLQLAGWSDVVASQPSGSAADVGIAIAEATRSTAAVTDAERAALADVESTIGPVPVASPVPLREMFLPTATFDSSALAAVLDGRHSEIRNKMRKLLAQPEFAYPGPLGHGEYRELVLEWAHLLANEGLGALAYPSPHGADDRGALVAAFSILAHRTRAT